AYFRDCQDHAYSQYGYQRLSHDILAMKSNPACQADKEIGCHYFIYQVILNSTFNVISTLTRADQIHEIELLNDLRDYLQSLKNLPINDHDCIDYLLNNKTLWHKCNFKFALTRINDNELPCHPLN